MFMSDRICKLCRSEIVSLFYPDQGLCDDCKEMLDERKKTIVAAEGNNLLVRVDAEREIGGMKYRIVRYEIWRDRDKFIKDVHEEQRDDGQFFYCSVYATTDEESMIESFKRVCSE